MGYRRCGCMYVWAMIAAAAAVGCKHEPAAAPAPAASDSCAKWSDFVCAHTAEQDSLCLTVQQAVQWLTPQTCALALGQKAYTQDQLARRAKQCGVLADKLCADMPGLTRFCKLAREKLRAYTPDFCVEMLSDYPRTLEQLAKQATADRLPPERAALLLEGDPPSFGPKNGKIQMVEFVDYESQYSPQTAAIVRKLAAKYSAQLHFVMRQFPLPDNPHAYLAAQAALAADAQGKYWEMHDKLLANREHLDRVSLLRYAKEVGLDVPAFKAALATQRYAAAVDADLALAKSLHVLGMPTLYVNGERLLNSVDEAGIVDAIEEYLAAGDANAIGTP